MLHPLLAVLSSCTGPADAPATPSTVPTPRPALPADDQTLPTPESCPGGPLTFRPIVTGATGPAYIGVQAATSTDGQICSVQCDESWMEVWVAATPDCDPPLPTPATVYASSTGVAICFAVDGEPSSPWSTRCRFAHSNNAGTIREVTW